jgi:hypothetical protein
MYCPKRSALTAVLFLPLIFAILRSVKWGTWNKALLLQHYDFWGVLLMLTTCAASQWPFANISMFVSQLPKRDLSINFFAPPKENISSLGRFMLMIVLGGVILVFLGGFSIYLAPFPVPQWVYAVVIVFFVWAGVWFFVTQYNIHICMANQKSEKLSKVSEALVRVLERSINEPTPVNIDQYSNLQGFYDKLASLPEWPFNTQNVITLFTGIVLPIALSILSLIAQK